MLPFAVPVLPATGQVPRFAAVPVPDCTTLWSIAEIWCAMSGLIAGAQSSPCTYSSPLSPTIDSTLYGGQCTPPFASVWKPEAMSSGVTSTEPVASASTAGMSVVMPILCASVTTFEAPTSWISCANTTFTESVVAWYRLMKPRLPGPSAFITQLQSLPGQPPGGKYGEVLS